MSYDSDSDSSGYISTGLMLTVYILVYAVNYGVFQYGCDSRFTD